MLKPAKSIELKSGKIISEYSPYFIAEMACAHDGSFLKAKELIDVAASSHADAVQLQFFHTSANVVRNHKLYPILESISFSEEQWATLVEYARARDIDVFVCAYDMPSLELAIKLQVDGIKFNSADLSNYEMLDRVALSGLPFTLGTGASRIDEIGEAVFRVLEQSNNQFILMHGMQSFPTAIEQANIRRLRAVLATFEALVGYADHTDGEDSFCGEVDLIALGMGASVFEKHFTLNRSEKGLDSQAALNPDQLADYIQRMRSGVSAMGETMMKKFNTAEKNYRVFQKKKLVTSRPLDKGCILTRSDLDLLRTDEGEGLEAGDLNDALGCKLKVSLDAQITLTKEYLERSA